jgi:predicted component of type VI protein secretion system
MTALRTATLIALLSLAACAANDPAAPTLHLRPPTKVTLEMAPARTIPQPLPLPR